MWTIIKTILMDEMALKKEAVLLNHLSKSVAVTFNTEQQARKVYGFMDKKKIVFKAPRVINIQLPHAFGIQLSDY